MPQSLSTILEVGQAVLAADGLEATIQIILEGARRLTGAHTVGLVQPEPTAGSLRCTHAVGRDAEALRSLPPELGAGLDGLNSRSVLAAPLLVNGVARGALVAYDSAPARFSETIGELLATLASLAGVALENVRLHEETRARAHRAEVVSEVARLISSSLDMPSLLSAVLHEIQRAVPCAAGSFAFYDPASHTVTFHEMLLKDPDANRGPVMTPADQTLAWRVMQSRQVFVVEDLRAIASPMATQRAGRYPGTLNLGRREPGPYSPEHIAILEDLSPHLAVAIGKAQLFEQAATRAGRMSRLAAASETAWS